jgi:myo-inositol 2-dehydrogenase / D-chiro-inositol 1-dehydrogenase
MNRPTRRALFQAASIVPFSAVRGTAANSAVTVGLLGCGSRGTFLAETFVEHTQGKLIALCDLYPEAIARTQARIGPRTLTVYQNFEKMLASPVDAVMIAPPVFLHPEHFEAAVQAGKHVYLEKPAAPDVAGCRRIERAASRAAADRDLTFGFQRRYGQVYNDAYRFLQSGKIGTLRMASARFIKSASARALIPAPPPKSFDEKVKNWYLWRALSGDLIVENNCHLIDVLNWFLGGHPESASGAGGRTAVVAGDARDHGSVSFQYPGKVQADLCGMTLAPSFHRDVREEFFGADGWLETSELSWRFRLSANEPVAERSPRNIAIDSVQAFVNRIQSGKPENTIARGVESTLTAILGRLAMDLRRPVTWSELMASGGDLS